MKTPLLKTLNLSKTFEVRGHRIEALRRANLEVLPGELIALMGPSGSGKTTLLSLIGCLDRATEGTILLDGLDITGVPEASLWKTRREKIGFVFQSFNLIDSLSAVENVELPMECTVRSAKQRRERARDLLNMVGLLRRERHRPAQLSAGEQQRVAVARALANGPRVILADEPTGNLDTETGLGIVSTLQGLTADERCTVLLATHDPRVASLADRTLQMRDGELLQ